jgi:tRNA pseudouridine38-40 synthase
VSREAPSSPDPKTDFAIERLRLLLAYDGRGFTGWQSQAGRRGVQDALEAALAKITGGLVRVHGSGRTDAGVHALGQCAHVDVPRGKHQPAVWLAALNDHLPREVRVMKVTRARGGRTGFHARYSARAKRYVYRIWNAPWLHPLEIGRAWHVPHALDVDVVRRAAAMYVGKHDFAGFAANRGQEEPDTVRTITRATVAKRGALITLTFEGDGFLYKMVRLLTGTVVRVGQGKAEASLIRELLAGAGKRKTQFAAPAEGLYLAKVFY